MCAPAQGHSRGGSSHPPLARTQLRPPVGASQRAAPTTLSGQRLGNRKQHAPRMYLQAAARGKCASTNPASQPAKGSRETIRRPPARRREQHAGTVCRVACANHASQAGRGDAAEGLRSPTPPWLRSRPSPAADQTSQAATKPPSHARLLPPTRTSPSSTALLPRKRTSATSMIHPAAAASPRSAPPPTAASPLSSVRTAHTRTDKPRYSARLRESLFSGSDHCDMSLDEYH